MSDTTPEETDETPAVGLVSQWQFVEREPTVEDVQALLANLPDVWGVSPVDYIDYVQALPQQVKIKVPHPENPAVKVDQYVDTWSLYMGVAGRIKMCQRAAEINGWRVDFIPEPITPTGAPGFISLDPRVVYREYVEITDISRLGSGPAADVVLGRKPGTAWSPASGGKSAEGSNPYEVVETSARGRALAAWGFGLLPGSGVASVEEMGGVIRNRAAMMVEGGARNSARETTRVSRQDLLAETFALAEELRQARGISEEEADARTAAYLSRLGVEDPMTPEGEIRWSNVKDGALLLLRNNLDATLRNLRDGSAPV